MNTLNSLVTALGQKYPHGDYSAGQTASPLTWKKDFLSFQDGKFTIEQLNFFQRIARILFRAYSSTHLSTILPEINRLEKSSLPKPFLDRMKASWLKGHPNESCPLQDYEQKNPSVEQNKTIEQSNPIVNGAGSSNPSSVVPQSGSATQGTPPAGNTIVTDQQQREAFFRDLPTLAVNPENLKKVAAAYKKTIQDKNIRNTREERELCIQYCERILDGSVRDILPLWRSIDEAGGQHLFYYIAWAGKTHLIDKVEGYENISNQFAILLPELDGESLRTVYSILFVDKKEFHYGTSAYQMVLETTKNEDLDRVYQGLTESTITRLVRSIFTHNTYSPLSECNRDFGLYKNSGSEGWAQTAIKECVSRDIGAIVSEISDMVMEFSKSRKNSFISVRDLFSWLSEAQIIELIQKLFETDHYYRQGGGWGHDPGTYQWPTLRLLLQTNILYNLRDEEYRRYLACLVKFFALNRDELLPFVTVQSYAHYASQGSIPPYFNTSHASRNHGLVNLINGLPLAQVRDLFLKIKTRDGISSELVKSLNSLYLSNEKKEERESIFSI